jgi:hypothetical protein
MKKQLQGKLPAGGRVPFTGREILAVNQAGDKQDTSEK